MWISKKSFKIGKGDRFTLFLANQIHITLLNLHFLCVILELYFAALLLILVILVLWFYVLKFWEAHHASESEYLV